MKYEIHIDDKLKDIVIRSLNVENDTTIYCSSPEKIAEALEKQAPKKPSHYKYNAFDGHPRCPYCNTSGCVSTLVEIGHDFTKHVRYGGIKNNYCTNCGQKIDWSEDND